jgi:hypothetical protein
VTEAKRRPRLSRLPPGLLDQSIFEQILQDLPQREGLPDHAARAERYVCLASEYTREFHTRKYRSGEINEALIDLKRKAAAYLEALRKSVGMIVDVYNEAAERDDWKVRREERDLNDHLWPASIPTIGETERITEAFLIELNRVQVPETDERGKKPIECAWAIVKQAATDFENITGKKPTRSNKAGGFVDFVRKLFAAISVQGNPDHYVRGEIGR